MVGLNSGQLFEQMMDDWIYYLIKNPVFCCGTRPPDEHFFACGDSSGEHDSGCLKTFEPQKDFGMMQGRVATGSLKQSERTGQMLGCQASHWLAGVGQLESNCQAASAPPVWPRAAERTGRKLRKAQKWMLRRATPICGLSRIFRDAGLLERPLRRLCQGLEGMRARICKVATSTASVQAVRARCEWEADSAATLHRIPHPCWDISCCQALIADACTHCEGRGLANLPLIAQSRWICRS